MKLSTTHVSRFKAAARVSVVAISIATLVGSPFVLQQTASADEYDQRIAALQREVDNYQGAAQSLANKANTLQNKVNKINAEKAMLQNRISLNEAKHKKLENDIKKTKQQIEENKNALGETLVNLWVDGDTSALEMLASSKNISDFIDKQAYQKNIRDSIGERIKEIEGLKTKLEKDKKSVESVLDDQKAQRKILASKEAEQQRLLSQTRGSERSYRNLVNSRSGQIQQLRQEQAAVTAAASGGGVSGGSASNLSGYPLYPGQCGPGNDGYGYWPCQCVSYVAYRLADDSRNTMNYRNLGDASNWWNAGREVSAGSISRGDVIVWLTGDYGHVMYVESVSGGTVYFTDFNGMGGPESPGSGSVSTSTATSYPMKVIRFR